MRRILWVKVGGLWPLNTGGRLRSFHLVSELSQRHYVTVLTTHGPGDDAAELARRLPRCEVVSVPYAIPKRGGARFARALLRSWLSCLPVDLWKCRVPALRHEVVRRLGAGVDLCVADFLAATVNVPLGGPVPIVHFAHNVEHTIWKRLRDVETRLVRRAVLELEWRKMRRSETEVCVRAPLTVAVSEIDREVLSAAAPGARIRAVPTGVDTTYFTPTGVAERPGNLVFVGSMDWYPNEDAVIHFVEAILPHVRIHVPEVSLTVAGRNPSPRLRALALAANVEVTGTVDDVRPYVARAAAIVVPLRVGGGTRLKIFEALAMGKAVVSTTIGAEGLPLTHGQDVVLADDPAHFAHEAVAVLRDPARRRTLGAAGRRLVEEKYAWPQVARRFETACEEVLQDAR